MSWHEKQCDPDRGRSPVTDTNTPKACQVKVKVEVKAAGRHSRPYVAVHFGLPNSFVQADMYR